MALVPASDKRSRPSDDQRESDGRPEYLGVVGEKAELHVISIKSLINASTMHLICMISKCDGLMTYRLDDEPLTAKRIKALRNDVAAPDPRGKLISKESLFK